MITRSRPVPVFPLLANGQAILRIITIIWMLCGLQYSAQGDSSEVFLSWLDGPAASFNSISTNQQHQKIHAGSDRLALRSSKVALFIDCRELAIPRLTINPPAGDPATCLHPTLPETNWEISTLTLTATINGHLCVARMRAYSGDSRKSDVGNPLDYPVRIIESGNWFNHVAIYGIEWVADDGTVHPGRGQMEVCMWGDRAVLTFSLKAVEPLNRVELQWQIPQLRFSQYQLEKKIIPGATANLQLGFRIADDQILPWSPAPGHAQVQSLDHQSRSIWNPASGSWEIQIGELTKAESHGHGYLDDLDRVTEVPFSVDNQSARGIGVNLRFIHPRHSITGFAIMLKDDKGRPTGIPVQTSKNWHHTKNSPLPYEGPWIHGSTRITIPPGSVRRLSYVIIHTRWQGIPAASAAQLSLVGWGYNGFWTEMALGSWGEHLCIQPGRLQRRCFLTDLRPLLVFNDKTQKPWGWTSNVGGGDSMVVIDPQGRYLPWGGVVSDFVANGPNLAQVRVRERSADGALALQTDTYLPRGEDFLRVYFDLQLEVKKELDFERLALFQLGSDFYNSGTPTTLSFGSGPDLGKSATPRVGAWEYVTTPVALTGSQPWVTLTGNKPNIEQFEGGGTRGLIIRHFVAMLNGRKITTPWLAAYRTQGGRLNAELVPPPGIKKLQPGDFVKMQLEVALFPLTAAAYYGPDDTFLEQLKTSADTWKMTAWEAHHNAPRATTNRGQTTTWPITVSAANAGNINFTISGGTGLVPLRITRLSAPHGWRLLENINGVMRRLGRRHAEEANPQVEFDRLTGTWTATLSLRPPATRSPDAGRSFQWVQALSQRPD